MALAELHLPEESVPVRVYDANRDKMCDGIDKGWAIYVIKHSEDPPDSVKYCKIQGTEDLYLVAVRDVE